MTRRMNSNNGQKKRKDPSKDDENSENVPKSTAKRRKACGASYVTRPTIAHVAVQCPPIGQLKETRACSEENVNMALRAMISDKDGDRLIHIAVAQENSQLVEHLCTVMLEADISLDITNHLRQTPLHVAAIVGNLAMLQLLLNYGCSLILKDRRGHTVLHLAIKFGANREVLELVLAHPEAHRIRNSLDYEGYSPLHYAVFKLNSEAVCCLYKGGAEINITDGKSGRSALSHAVLAEDAEMVRVLLQCGASKDSTDFSGRSVTDTALLVGSRAVLDLLQQGKDGPVKEEGRRRRTSSTRSKN